MAVFPWVPRAGLGLLLLLLLPPAGAPVIVPEAARATAVEAEPEADAASATLTTFGDHQYWTVWSTHPAEAPVAASPDGTVWMAGSPGGLPVPPSLSQVTAHLNTPSLYRTSDGGRTWTGVTLPVNVGTLFYPEGDVVVAPNRDVLTAWVSTANLHAPAVYVKTAQANAFAARPVAGPVPVPDRPAIMVSSAAPDAGGEGGVSVPINYIGIVEAGLGLPAAKRTYASLDGGLTWVVPPVAPPHLPGVPVLEAALPLGKDPYLDYAKPLGQGMRQGTGPHFIPLSDGAVFSPEAVRWSKDLVTWYQPPDAGAFPHFQSFPFLSEDDWPWWEASSAGVLFVVRVTEDEGWKVQYKWYDGAWHDGGCEVPLSDEPNYLLGPQQAAVKSHGTLLGINTREGDQDVLIRIWNASSLSPVCHKELIGQGSSGRTDFPALGFDRQGRAIVSYTSGYVGYATTP